MLVGEPAAHVGGSAYARTIRGLEGTAAGSAPPVDLKVEQRNAALVRKLIREGLVHAVHDISEGGLACAMADMALSSGVGAFVDLYRYYIGGPNGAGPGVKLPGILFGEDNARYIAAAPRGAVARIAALAKEAGVPCDCFSETDGFRTGDGIAFNFDEFGIHGVDLATLRGAHEGWMPTYMKGGAT